MSVYTSLALSPSASLGVSAFAECERFSGGVQGLARRTSSLGVCPPKAVAEPWSNGGRGRPVERATNRHCGSQRSNNALLTDTYSSPLRARRGAAKRER